MKSRHTSCREFCEVTVNKGHCAEGGRSWYFKRPLLEAPRRSLLVEELELSGKNDQFAAVGGALCCSACLWRPHR